MTPLTKDGYLIELDRIDAAGLDSHEAYLARVEAIYRRWLAERVELGEVTPTR